MFRRCIQTGIRSIPRMFRTNSVIRDNINSGRSMTRGFALLAGSAALLKQNLDNIDLNLQGASEVGEEAIIQIMDMLRDNIVEICYKYRKCLQKQIDIIREATDLGPLSARWDDLPEYRTLAADLNEQLTHSLSVLNSVGQIAYDESLKYITQNQSHLNTISQKYKELEELMRTQMIEIRKLEKSLLKIRKDSINFSLGSVS